MNNLKTFNYKKWGFVVAVLGLAFTIAGFIGGAIGSAITYYSWQYPTASNNQAKLETPKQEPVKQEPVPEALSLKPEASPVDTPTPKAKAVTASHEKKKVKAQVRQTETQPDESVEYTDESEEVAYNSEQSLCPVYINGQIALDEDNNPAYLPCN